MLGATRMDEVSDKSPFGRECLRARSRPNGDLSLTTRVRARPRLHPSHLEPAANTTCNGPPMVLNPESKYPNRRAYVLKLRGDATPDALAGRLENLVTGQQIEFASARELLESLVRDLETEGGERSTHAQSE